MRSTIAAAAFVAGAIAVPFHEHQHLHKRQAVDYVSDVDVVFVTDIVTVVAGAEPTPAAATSEHEWHHWSWPHWSSKPEPSTSEAAPTTTTEPIPTTSTYVAPTTTVVASPTSSAQSSSAPASSPATTAAPTSVAAAAPTTYSETVVYHHNIHRKNHTAPAIQWSQDLADLALSMAQVCVYAHNVTSPTPIGQNIAAGVESNNISAVITDMMYNGEMGWYDDLYNQAQPSMANFENWGHFSQIVWKDTTHVGCATYDCSSTGLANTGSDVSPWFSVCNYSPPGNYANEYGANVLTPLGYPTAQWNTGS